MKGYCIIQSTFHRNIRNNCFAVASMTCTAVSKFNTRGWQETTISKLKLDHSELCFTDSVQLQMKKKTQNIYIQNTTTDIKFDCFIISFDHFLQPKDNNTQHKSKISHVIFIHHHEFFSVQHSFLEDMGLRFSSACQTHWGHPALLHKFRCGWIASVKYLRRGHMNRYTSKTTDTFTDYKGILMEKAIIQACDTVSTWSNNYTQTNDAQLPLTDHFLHKKICFPMKINENQQYISKYTKVCACIARYSEQWWLKNSNLACITSGSLHKE